MGSENIMQKKMQMRAVAVSVIIFSFLAHGYRFFNNMYSHDSLLMIYQNDYAWQISLGRYVQPLWIFLRGSISSPWLITLLTMIWLAGAGYLGIDILKINNKYSFQIIVKYKTSNLFSIVLLLLGDSTITKFFAIEFPL